MANRAIHWHEGMFLRPQHFQTEQRFWFHQEHRNSKLDCHYNWGLRAIDLDTDALANNRFTVSALTARLRDGTLLCIPDDGTLPELELKAALENGQTVTVYLALPTIDLAKANVAGLSEFVDGQRYRLDTLELEDENTGVNPQPVMVRLLNLKLLLSTQDRTGYEVLPLARVEKSSRAEAAPQLDVSYIPPVLACDAWEPLSALVRSVYDRLGRKIEVLAGQIVSQGITFDSRLQGDQLLLTQLRELNRAYTRLRVLAFAQGVHPFYAYLELCELVGQLAIFGAARRPPELPNYDHDDLGGCFYRVKQYLDELLDLLVEPAYRERPFIGAGLRMQVSLEAGWLEPTWQMFIGIQSPLKSDECIRLMTQPGQLDMKIGSSERVDNIFRLGRAGLRFDYQPNPPRALPSLPGLIYFQVRREAHEEEWQNVQRSLTLALRLNENFIVGNIQGQRSLTLKLGSQTIPMQFTLFVAPAT